MPRNLFVRILLFNVSSWRAKLMIENIHHIQIVKSDMQIWIGLLVWLSTTINANEAFHSSKLYAIWIELESGSNAFIVNK